MLDELAVVNVANLLTLRYDPDTGNNGTIRNISYQDVLNSRQSSRVPSSEEIEAKIRAKINEVKIAAEA